MFHRWGDVTPVIKWKVILWWNGHTRPRRVCSNAAPPRWFTAEHTFPPPFSSRPPSWPQPASAPLNRSKSFVSTSNFKVYSYRSKTIWIILETEVRKHTVCPGSNYPIYIVTYYIKWGNNSWTHGNRKVTQRWGIGYSYSNNFFRYVILRTRGSVKKKLHLAWFSHLNEL